ncbi:MAG: ABC transporter substrate-binding protein [Alphaproteobacteria bacterium]|nr:ABC transporter substrate-binding protein [Alphaproteobacteria bacterium]
MQKFTQKLQAGKSFYRLTSLILMFSMSILTASCSAPGGYNNAPWRAPTTQASAQQRPDNLALGRIESQELDAQQNANLPQEKQQQVKVAILLPLSGPHQKLGESLLNAAQMAVFDLGHEQFILVPKDTKGTEDGARMAARQAINEDVSLVLGPVFSDSVSAARQVTQSANINMISFSTDWRLANRKTFLIGFLPFDQVERVTQYASSSGIKRIGVFSPSDNYGNAVVSAYQAIAHNYGVTSRIERFTSNGSDINERLRRFSDYDARKESKETFGPPFDAVLMPVGGPVARQIGSFLEHYDLPSHQVRRLGTGLLDDDSLATDSTLDGAWFAAPDPAARQKFERSYRNIYGKNPPRIASLGYDAAALAAILARKGLKEEGRPAFDHASITNPNGFAGVDGIFRFRQDGISERGLAILEYRRGAVRVIEKAPKTFQRTQY